MSSTTVFTSFVLLVLCSSIKYSNGKKLEPMVIGGSNAERHQFPYMVSLQSSEEHICGGSILSQTWVVTAGHCCDEKYSSDLECLEFKVVAGLLNQGEIHPDVQSVSVAQVVHHPGYFLIIDKDINNDIALLKLSSPLKITNAVKPIKLPTVNQEFKEGWVSGWGVYMRPWLFPVTLQFIKMQIINNTVCRDFLDRFDENVRLETLYDTMVCTLPPTGLETPCSHDSGGPLSYNNTLIGIVSWGVICTDYHVGAPSVFTAVDKFIDFISKHVSDLAVFDK